MEVYADYAATTPVKPEVIDAMMEIYQSHFGNPSSIHSIGRDARKYLDQSRRTVAQLLGANPNEVIFTSGATESNNTAIKGLVKANEQLGNHIITTKIEHHSVLHVYEQLEKEGYDVTYLDVDDTGAVDLDQLKETINDRTILVSIMFVNNVHLMNLKELFLVQLQERAIPFELNGSMTDSTGHILNIYFPFIDVETMLTLLDLAHVYVSSGSACTAGSTTPSHVLAAMFEDEERAKHSVRFSFNEQTTTQEIKYIVAEIHKIYHKFKEES
ncbi:MAG: cysteine desulfurase family protein [Staphylococcus epidermidis]|nr:cysteine desulfurase family protein [Staphylococcus epidermidis]